MKHIGQSRVLNNVVSPYGLAIFSYAIFLFACLLPPSLYQRCMDEPDFMFLDSSTILFYTLCVLAFLSGVWLFEKLYPTVPANADNLEVRFNPTAFLLIPLLLCVALSLLSSYLLLNKNPMIIPLMMDQQAVDLRSGDASGLQLEGTLNSSLSLLIAVTWWAAWRFPQARIQRRGKWLIRFSLSLALLTIFISSTLHLARHPFVLTVSGLAILFILRKIFAAQLAWRMLAKTVLVLAIAGTLFFVLVDLLRGASDWAGQLDAFVGYTIASYNRLAGLVQGRIHPEYAGKGIYFSVFLSFSKAFNSVIPFGTIMNVPDYNDWWRSEFTSVGNAGLDPGMIFWGSFGDIFVELGWFAPLYVFGSGLLYGLVWRWIRRGSLLGVLLYPYFAYLILFWFSMNALFEADTVGLLVCAVILGIYETLFVIQRKTLEPVLSLG